MKIERVTADTLADKQPVAPNNELPSILQKLNTRLAT